MFAWAANTGDIAVKDTYMIPPRCARYAVATRRAGHPPTRGRKGTKDHLLTDGGGIPLAAHATAANRHDVTQLKALVEEVPPVTGKPGASQAQTRGRVG